MASLRSSTTRLRRPTVAAIALGAAVFAGAGPAYALPLAPGDNGDVKVHASTTPPTDQRNDPKVCLFYLAAFNFDTVQQVTYTIAAQPPKADGPVLGGSITLTDGTGHTGTLTLPNGQYKLVWTFAGENGAGKQKVFMVDCPPGTTGGTTTGGTTAGTTGGTTAGTTGGRPAGSVNAGGGGGASTFDAGEVTVGAVVAGAALAGFGVHLVRRRRATGDGTS
ncbi:hypothetical protein [Embleya hyalina]|uniref:Uncharacterized protein n=1 Tax=Embleya hyalina TaxID=516124 RepID=A0A401YK42_9ACTN|nr:hypothetical protein [Embleya hyalina]GCD94992.1 hypothetical protein EHYA_02661 [Embleya hyalina]